MGTYIAKTVGVGVNKWSTLKQTDTHAKALFDRMTAAGETPSTAASGCRGHR